MVANALLYFNEYIDDKCLRFWLKSSLDSAAATDNDPTKAEIILNYTNTWKFIYSCSVLQKVLVLGFVPLLWWSR